MNEKATPAADMLRRDYGISLPYAGAEDALAALEKGREASLGRFAGFAPWPDADQDAYFEPSKPRKAGV